MKNFMLAMVAFFLCELAVAQAPATLWTKALGGTNIERGPSVVQTSDGGFAAIGHTYSFGPTPANLWLVRTNAQGDTLWTRIFNGPANSIARSIKETPDRGFILLGDLFASATSFDFWLIRTDSLGGVVWSKVFGTIVAENAGSVDRTHDGGFVVAGTRYADPPTTSDVWLLKTNANGDTLWTRILGGTLGESATSVRETADRGFIITGGVSTPTASGDVLLIKTDSTGQPEWTRTYGGTLYEGGAHVEQTHDGGYIIAGASTPSLNNNDVYLIKTQSNGNVSWSKNYGISALADFGNCVQQTSDSGYIVVGATLNSGNYDLWMIKTNQNGDTSWTRRLGGAQNDVGSFVRQTSDGGYIVSGHTQSFGAGGSEDLWLVRFAGPPSSVGDETNGVAGEFMLYQNYPNPFNPGTRIGFRVQGSGLVTLKIYDVLGREVTALVNEKMQPGRYEVSWDATGMASGVYLYRLQVGASVQTRKGLLLR